jgi:hypothetical protein
MLLPFSAPPQVDPMHGCQIGTTVLFCMPNRTDCVLLGFAAPHQVDPRFVLGFATHYGLTLAGGRSARTAEDCAFIIHLVDLFRQRTEERPEVRGNHGTDDFGGLMTPCIPSLADDTLRAVERPKLRRNDFGKHCHPLWALCT